MYTTYMDINGLLHRDNGPAIINSYDGSVEYWIHGIRFETKEQYEKALKLKAFL